MYLEPWKRSPMCTLIAIHRCVPGFPLLIAANRDEYLDRPSEGPRLHRVGENWAIAPMDLRAGGTWLGLNEHGVFAALTNVRTASPDPSRKSRGMVVMEALEAGSAEQAIEALGALAEGAYNPFNCFVADAERAYSLVYQDRPRIDELSSGVHVIGNSPAGEAGNHKLTRILERATQAIREDEPLEALGGVCREHGSGGDPLADTCVHAGDTYGTRSSMLIELAEGQGTSRLLYADGPPCTDEYEDFSSLLSELRQAPGYGSTEVLARNAS